MTDIAPWNRDPDVRRDVGIAVSHGHRIDIQPPGEPRQIAKADPYMALLAHVQRQLVALGAQRLRWQDQLDEWWKAQTRVLADTADAVTDALERFGVEVREQSGDEIKTVNLTAGRIATRKVAEPKLRVQDSDQVVRWAFGLAAEDRLDQPLADLVAAVRKYIDHPDYGEITALQAAIDRLTLPPALGLIRWVPELDAKRLDEHVVIAPVANDDGEVIGYRAVASGGGSELVDVPGLVVDPPKTTAKVTAFEAGT